jgi:uncharacterized pyridoxamine 5'-phosphate oxidase family protein
MKKLTEDIIKFFQNQGYVIVSTVDRNGFPHNSCKGIAIIKKNGYVYLVDVYKAKTYHNLRRNPKISVTAVDEHKFKGYCLKGKAKIILTKDLGGQILREWETRIADRITKRVIKNIHEEKGHPKHPEALLPEPEYLIVMQVKSIVDLAPRNLV